MSPTRIVSFVAATFVLAAGSAPGFAAPDSAAPPVSPPAPQGIDPGNVDRAADPCTDFDAFANGAWRAANPIPAGRQSWSRRLAAREANREQLMALLGELAAKADRPRGSVEQLLGDHFAACMDEGAIEAAGVAPLAPLLADIAGAHDGAGIQRIIRRLHELGIPAPFVVSAASDYQDPASVVVRIAAAGLGLPGRDHYLGSEPRFAEAREKYRAHVAAVLALGGMPAGSAGKAALDVVAFETRLAEASLAPAAAADPAATAHKRTFAQLAAARFDWARYFAEAGLPRGEVNVAEPAFLQRLDVELEATPVAVWKAYLTWHLLESASPWLSSPFAEESFAFRDRYLRGATAMEPRAARCLESAETLLGEPLGRKYAERHFPPAARRKVEEMVRGLRAILEDEVGRIGWMTPEARQEALAKLAAYQVKVGYPDEWEDHSSLVIRRDAFWANVAAGRRFRVEAERRRAGTRAAREIWQLPPSSPAAYIDVQLNQMVLPAGFLQSWAFDPAATDAVNYGAIGAGIAHDLTHAIDRLGADFDSSGQARHWWTERDREAFQAVGQCLVDQHDGYAIEPGVSHQGKRVLGEAFGDLAGVHVAYRALRRSMESRPVPATDGFSPEQQFFIAWGQLRGAAETLAHQRQMVKADPHPTARYRVIGPLSNMPEFQQAFACKAGSAMVRPPERRCRAW